MRSVHVGCCAAAIFIVLSAASAAQAADLRVRVTGLRDTSGQIWAAVCTETTFLGPECPYTAKASAHAGVIVVHAVPPGHYAVQVFHDENANGKIDRGVFLPLEGMGFSRDAPIRFGPPKFGDAVVGIDRKGGSLVVKMRYF